MNVMLRFILKHGYSFLFAAMFAHQIGIPVPGPLLLLAAGALAAAKKLHFATVVVLTITACVLADWLHRLTTHDPDFHDRRAKKVFARYGPPLLLVSKFVPGLDTVMPPLAGTSGTSRLRFLAFDGLGAALYACVYGGLGYAFSHNLDRAAAYASRAGALLLGVAFLGICVYYTARKLVQRYRVSASLDLRQFHQRPPVPPETPSCPGVLGGHQNGN